MRKSNSVSTVIDLNLAQKADRKLRRYGSDLNKFLSNIVNVRGFAKNLFAYCQSEHRTKSTVRQD